MGKILRKKRSIREGLILLSLTAILFFWGQFLLFTISVPYSLTLVGKGSYFFLHQLLVGIIPAVIIGLFFYFLPLQYIKKLSFWLFVGNLFLVSLTFLPAISLKIGGARRWLKLGPIVFQPAEFLKITFLFYLSAWLVRKKKEKEFLNLAFLIFILFTFLLTLLLIFQPDFSTLIIIFFSALSVYFVAKTPFFHSIIFLLLGVVGSFLAIKLAPYRFHRFRVFLNPELDPLGIGYQLKQSQIALGSGGIFGRGELFGFSFQKFNFLPNPMTDSIFAVLGEETGFLGSSFLILLFLILFFEIFRISKKSKDLFGRILAIGFGTWIVGQAFFNIGGISGALPLAGVPLPFFSYGGSHLIAEFLAIGILLNIAKNC